MDVRSVVNCLFLFECLTVSLTSHCGTVQNITHSKIPARTHLLSLEGFDKYVVDHEMARLYHVRAEVSTVTETQEPDINSFSTIIQVEGTSAYMQSTFGEFPDVSLRCSSSKNRLTPVLWSDSAIFSLEDENIVLAFWSSCPTRYVWSMQCSKYNIGKRNCLSQNVILGLYIHGNLDDLPMKDIADDLCSATDVKFGVQNFKWIFTYGQDTKCRPL